MYFLIRAFFETGYFWGGFGACCKLYFQTRLRFLFSSWLPSKVALSNLALNQCAVMCKTADLWSSTHPARHLFPRHWPGWLREIFTLDLFWHRKRTWEGVSIVGRRIRPQHWPLGSCPDIAQGEMTASSSLAQRYQRSDGCRLTHESVRNPGCLCLWLCLRVKSRRDCRCFCDGSSLGSLSVAWVSLEQVLIGRRALYSQCQTINTSAPLL